MQKLQVLALRDNQLTGGIPAELGNLVALKELWLNNNQLTGGISADLGTLIALQKLLLERNPLGSNASKRVGMGITRSRSTQHSRRCSRRSAGAAVAAAADASWAHPLNSRAR